MYYADGRNDDINTYLVLIGNAIESEKDIILNCKTPALMELRVSSKYEERIAHFFQNAFERYVADYVEWNTKPARNASIEGQIKRIKERKLYPLEAKLTTELKRLSTLNGIFNASKRKDCKISISKIEAKINSTLAEISLLENKAAQNERERELEIASFRALSDDDIREKARETAVNIFKESFETTMLLLKNHQSYGIKPGNPVTTSSYGEELAKPMATASGGAKQPKTNDFPAQEPVYATESAKERTFTGNQSEDYSKIRGKILSGEVNTEELREFEIKWGYLP